MRAAPQALPLAGASGRVRRWGALALLVAVLLSALQPPWQMRLREAWFDALQMAAPRQPRSSLVVVVAIDDASLAALGQWPWPRSLLAELVGRIAEQHPAAVGIDVLMPERDRLSPTELVGRIGRRDPELAERLAALPGNDQLLAEAIAAAPVVLAVAGAASAAGGRLHAPPVLVSGRPDPDGVARLPRYPAAIANLEALDQAAAGHGVISGEPTGVVFRRFPLVFDLQGTLSPSFGLEMLRVTHRQGALRLVVDAGTVRAVAVGNLTVPTEGDGAVRVHYSRAPRPLRLSAADVLRGRIAPDLLHERLVLIGATAVALSDRGATALGEFEPGVEIQAQLIENLLDRAWLLRPPWALAVELAALIASGLLLVWATSRWTPVRAAALALATAGVFGVASLAAFVGGRLLIDATPGVYLLALFAALAVSALADAAQRRRALERAIQAQREREAFVTGELEAARRIQAGMLPSTDTLRTEHRIELGASMQPAREVGGDLYDFFLLDGDRLCFLIGDVSGKGVAASLFMALAKSLCRSIATRSPQGSPAQVLSATSAELARDNAEQLFVTAVVGVLDLHTGELNWSNAGHDDPILVPADGTSPTRLACGGGPPLCALDGFTYAGTTVTLRPGDALVLASDGLTESRDPDGTLYGGERLMRLLGRLQLERAGAPAIVDALRRDAEQFAGGAEPADDLTVLVVRWLGAGDAA